jgi:hypothetical protein
MRAASTANQLTSCGDADNITLLKRCHADAMPQAEHQQQYKFGDRKRLGQTTGQHEADAASLRRNPQRAVSGRTLQPLM